MYILYYGKKYVRDSSYRSPILNRWKNVESEEAILTHIFTGAICEKPNKTGVKQWQSF